MSEPSAQWLVDQAVIAYLRHRASPDGIAVFELRGRWHVRWRDFMTVKQDMEFPSEDLARIYANGVRYGDHALHAMPDYDDLLDAATFWLEFERNHA